MVLEYLVANFLVVIWCMVVTVCALAAGLFYMRNVVKKTVIDNAAATNNFLTEIKTDYINTAAQQKLDLDAKINSVVSAAERVIVDSNARLETRTGELTNKIIDFNSKLGELIGFKGTFFIMHNDLEGYVRKIVEQNEEHLKLLRMQYEDRCSDRQSRKIDAFDAYKVDRRSSDSEYKVDRRKVDIPVAVDRRNKNV